MKRISIIVPMYNSFHMMGRNLEVLEKQKNADIELIIVDDCSTDDSFARAQEYAQASKLRIKVVKNKKNCGPGCSRNHGLKYVTGDYITFADSDDYFTDDFTQVLAPLLETETDCIVFDYLKVDEHGNKILSGKTINKKNIQSGAIDSNTALVYCSGATCGKIYRKEVIFENDVRFAEFFRNEDMPFTKYAIAMSNTVYYCRAQLYCYVQVSTSLMHNSKLLDERNAQNAFAILSKNLAGKEFDDELLALELREVLNNTVLIKIAKREPRAEIKRYISEHYKKGHLRNKYFCEQRMYVKIISYCAYYKFLFALSLIWKLKQRKMKH